VICIRELNFSDPDNFVEDFMKKEDNVGDISKIWVQVIDLANLAPCLDKKVLNTVMQEIVL